mmetsp:Transcript_15689/g.61281  ORF Transcript_15689/g.61281 Transcript_15689/m.61281 type:complete len:311 (+) Transcript_15689:197-1129(+)
MVEQLRLQHAQNGQRRAQEAVLVAVQVDVPHARRHLQLEGLREERQDPVHDIYNGADVQSRQVPVQRRQVHGSLLVQQLHQPVDGVHVHPVEAQQHGAVEDVGEAHKRVVGLEEEQEHGGEVAHALHVADVGPVTDVGLEHLAELAVEGAADAEEGERGEGARQVERDQVDGALLADALALLSRGAGARRLLQVDCVQLAREVQLVADQQRPHVRPHARRHAQPDQLLGALRRLARLPVLQHLRPELRVLQQAPLPLLAHLFLAPLLPRLLALELPAHALVLPLVPLRLLRALRRRVRRPRHALQLRRPW